MLPFTPQTPRVARALQLVHIARVVVRRQHAPRPAHVAQANEAVATLRVDLAAVYA